MTQKKKKKIIISLANLKMTKIHLEFDSMMNYFNPNHNLLLNNNFK